MGLVRPPLQRGPRQRLREPRQPHRLDDEPLPRGCPAGAARRPATRRSPRAGRRRWRVVPRPARGLPPARRARPSSGSSSAARTRPSMPSGRGTSPRPPRPATTTAATRLRRGPGRPPRDVPAGRAGRDPVHAGDRAARAGPARVRLSRTGRTATADRRSSTSSPGAPTPTEAGRVTAPEPLFPRLELESGRHRARPGVTAVPRLVDSHCHLNADRFEGDADLVLGGARLAGVERILVPGWNVASSERALALADRFAGLDVGVGVHPHDAAKVDDAGWARIVELAGDPRVAAIGETGLDYDRVFSPIPDQLTNLRRNLALALATGKPAILHCRSRERSTRRPGRPARGARGGRGGGCSMADRVRRPAARDHPLVFGPGRLRRRGHRARVSPSASPGSCSGPARRRRPRSPRWCPADRVLVETDSPFLAPPGAPRSRNEPEWVRVTAGVARRAARDDARGPRRSSS